MLVKSKHSIYMCSLIVLKWNCGGCSLQEWNLRPLWQFFKMAAAQPDFSIFLALWSIITQTLCQFLCLLARWVDSWHSKQQQNNQITSKHTITLKKRTKKWEKKSLHNQLKSRSRFVANLTNSEPFLIGKRSAVLAVQQNQIKSYSCAS